MLVDTFMTIGENERLVDWVKSHGRDLTHIFLTHGTNPGSLWGAAKIAKGAR